MQIPCTRTLAREQIQAPCTRSLDSMIPGSFFTRIESLIACRWSRVQRNLHAHEPSGSDWIRCSTPPTPVGGACNGGTDNWRKRKRRQAHAYNAGVWLFTPAPIFPRWSSCNSAPWAEKIDLTPKRSLQGARPLGAARKIGAGVNGTEV